MNLSKLIQQGESETLEFKESFDKKTIVSLGAMANTRGGAVLIGVNNKGEAKEVQRGKETLQQWANDITQATDPKLIPYIRSAKIKGNTVVEIRVKEHSPKPISVSGRCYRRVANSNKQLTPKEIADLHLHSTGGSWDALPAKGAKISDLDLKKVSEYMKLANESGRRKLRGNPLSVLKKLEFIVGGKPTWASILLFGKNPNRFVWQAKVKCGYFKTPSLIADDNVLEGTLLEQVEATMKAIIKNIRVRYEIKSIRRKEIWDYPIEALREAVLNAICHRDYTSGSNTIIRIFDDHIHFWNSGELLGNLTVEELLKNKHKSVVRNKLIAQYFYDIGEIEQYGSGIQRMMDACKKAGLPLPEIGESQEGFEVTFRKGKEYVEEEKLFSASGDETGLTLRQERVIEYIEKHERITNSQFQEIFKVSKSTATRELSDLIERGYLRKLGTTGKGTEYALAKGS